MTTTGEPIPTGVTPETAPAPKIPPANLLGLSHSEVQARQGLASKLATEASSTGVDSALDKLAGKDNWGTPEPTRSASVDTEDSQETIRYPDRERLLQDLEDRTEGFFGMARVRARNIEDATQGINKSHRDLAEVRDDGPGIVGRVRDTSTSPIADEVINLVGQTARRIDEQIEDARSTMQNLGIDDQLDYLRRRESELTGGGMEQYKDALRETLKIQDPEQRAMRLTDLKQRIIEVTERIKEDSTRSSKKGSEFEVRTKQRSSGSPGRLESAEIIIPKLQAELGYDFGRVIGGIREMREAYGRFRSGTMHIEILPHEFRLLTDAAGELGYGVEQIFAIFEQGKFT